MIARSGRYGLLALAGMLAAGCTEKPEALDFQPCKEDPKLQCASLRVPLHNDRPSGASVSLSVIRAPATDAGKRKGVLFVNPGGPGASGFEVVLRGVHAPVVVRLRDHFDIVSFDVRSAADRLRHA